MSAGYLADLMLVDRLLVDPAHRHRADPCDKLIWPMQTDSICQYQARRTAGHRRGPARASTRCASSGGPYRMLRGTVRRRQTSLLSGSGHCGGQVGDLARGPGGEPRHTELIERPEAAGRLIRQGFRCWKQSQIRACCPDATRYSHLRGNIPFRRLPPRPGGLRGAPRCRRPVHPLRYERYRQLIRELDEKWRMRYG